MLHRSRRVALGLLMTFAAVAGGGGAIETVRAGTSCTAVSDALTNGGFETPAAPVGAYEIFDASVVAPWQTTDVANGIELWSDGYEGVPAFEGAQFAELNANSAGTLYQDVTTTPGATMTWTLQHRGRFGDDVMRVLIGDPAVADVDSDAGWDSISADITDGVDAWGAATGTYLVPEGQVCTRFAFRAVSAVGGDSQGNFLDAVGFEVSIPAGPTPAPTARPTPPATDAPMPDRVDGSPDPLSAIVLLSGALAVMAVSARARAARRD